MTLKLMPDILRAAYAFLCETEPFRNWNLPDPEDVAFKVARDKTAFGWHTFDGIKHTIFVSENLVGHTDSLFRLMGHEMIHVHEQHSGACKRGVEHSKAFNRWAAQVCRVHGFDPKLF
jgi:hypothetical protein